MSIEVFVRLEVDLDQLPSLLERLKLQLAIYPHRVEIIGDGGTSGSMNFEKVSSKALGDKLPIVLNPPDEEVFKNKLLKTRKAEITVFKTDQPTKKAFRKFLVDHGGLTENSSRSYITYLNSILINMQGTKTEPLNSRTPLQLLVESAKSAKSEASFIKALAKPLTGPEGRIGDLTSTAKQFYRFNHFI